MGSTNRSFWRLWGRNVRMTTAILLSVSLVLAGMPLAALADPLVAEPSDDLPAAVDPSEGESGPAADALANDPLAGADHDQVTVPATDDVSDAESLPLDDVPSTAGDEPVVDATEPPADEPAPADPAPADPALSVPATDGAEEAPVEQTPVEEAEPAEAAVEDDPLLFEAASSRDIILGAFYSSDSNLTDTIYASTDGKSFKKVATAFNCNKKDKWGTRCFADTKGNFHYGHSDPSIMYHNGYFWMLSNWQRNDGKFWPMISYSKDLVHWTYPEGDGLITGTRGITLANRPSSGNDIVAPEWYRTSSGEVYIVFSAGYYGAWHGNPTVDRMEAYIVRVSELSAKDGSADGSTGYLWPKGLTFRAGSAQRLTFSAGKNSNYIDGSMFQEGKTSYLFIKKGGLTTQVYKTTTPGNASSYQLVNSSALSGYEGMTVAKLGSTYFAYPDHVSGTTADGVRMTTSRSITGNWATPKAISFAGSNGVRHGTVITLKEGTAEWAVAAKLTGLAPISLSKASVAAIGVQGYTGKAVTPKPKVTYGSLTLKEGTDYQLTYQNNVNIGTATVTITGRGSYTGSTKTTFRIANLVFKRLAGDNRYTTMSAIVRAGWSTTGGTVVVARGDDFKDALAASGLAGLYEAPVVLTESKQLTAEAKAQLQRLKPTQVFVAGGTVAVSNTVLKQIADACGLKVNKTVVRVFGQTSLDTSAKLALAGSGLWEDATAIIATNGGYKDALSVAPVSYALHWPILLSSPNKGLTKEVLDALNDLGIERAYIVGGELAVKPQVVTQLEQAGITVVDRLWGQSAVQTSRAIAEWALDQGLSADHMGFATSQNFPDALSGAALCGKRGGVLLLADDTNSATAKNVTFATTDHKDEITTGYVFGGEFAFSERLYSLLNP